MTLALPKSGAIVIRVGSALSQFFHWRRL